MKDYNIKDSTIKKVANKITMIRRAHNLTQEAFAQFVNIETRKTISYAKNGKTQAGF